MDREYVQRIMNRLERQYARHATLPDGVWVMTLQDLKRMYHYVLTEGYGQ